MINIVTLLTDAPKPVFATSPDHDGETSISILSQLNNDMNYRINQKTGTSRNEVPVFSFLAVF